MWEARINLVAEMGPPREPMEKHWEVVDSASAGGRGELAVLGACSWEEKLAMEQGRHRTDLNLLAPLPLSLAASNQDFHLPEFLQIPLLL